MSIKRKLILCILSVVLLSGGILFVAALGIRGAYGDLFYQVSLIKPIVTASLAMFISVLVIICMALAVMVFILIKSVINPLNQLLNITSQIKNGNLDFEIKYNNKDEFEKVFSEFDEMRLRLIESMEKQAKLERERKEMVVGIVHDVKTPLTSISGHVQGLLDGIADTPEKREKYLHIIRRKSEEVDKLVTELFLFSKFDLNQIPFDIKETCAKTYFMDVLKEIELEKGTCQIEIQSVEDAGIIHIDSMQFKRVLVNIVENSIKYRKGDIAGITVRISRNSGNIVVKMTDDGIGIDDGDTEKIFDWFFRSDAARSNTGSGSGIGLSLAKQIVEAHGGKIWARSKEGAGVSVYISLPLSEVMTH